ncbi:hypothetical protein ACFQY0_14740 [Haloferula chungangensis]|uniref:Uncharacterized protein n=2 Tax=Haloferula chungangensis TaxID=1048331 RepID=A0ABW2LAV7_9BACT
MSRICIALLVVVGAVFPVALNGSESVSDGIYESPRIGRLLKIARLSSDDQRPKRYMRILGKQGGDCDIGQELKPNIVRVIRIWSLGESTDRVRTISVKKDGTAEVTVKFYPSSPDKKYEIDSDAFHEFAGMIESLLLEPVAFKRTSMSTGSNSVDYIMESLSEKKYRWAVREADFSPAPDYQAMGKVIEWLRSREKSGVGP